MHSNAHVHECYLYPIPKMEYPGSSRVSLWTLITVILCISPYTNCVDPCQSGVVTLPHSEKRDVGTTPTESICDKDAVVPGRWYRVSADARERMPEACPATYSCGTLYPIWISGTHPTDDSIKDMKVYINGAGNCHYWPGGDNTVSVKRCSSLGGGYYYIYQLPNPSICSVAFCKTRYDNIVITTTTTTTTTPRPTTTTPRTTTTTTTPRTTTTTPRTTTTTTTPRTTTTTTPRTTTTTTTPRTTTTTTTPRTTTTTTPRTTTTTTTPRTTTTTTTPRTTTTTTPRTTTTTTPRTTTTTTPRTTTTTTTPRTTTTTTTRTTTTTTPRTTTTTTTPRTTTTTTPRTTTTTTPRTTTTTTPRTTTTTRPRTTTITPRTTTTNITKGAALPILTTSTAAATTPKTSTADYQSTTVLSTVGVTPGNVEGKSVLPVPLIAGAVGGFVALLSIVLAVVFFVCTKKRRRTDAPKTSETPGHKTFIKNRRPGARDPKHRARDHTPGLRLSRDQNYRNTVSSVGSFGTVWDDDPMMVGPDGTYLELRDSVTDSGLGSEYATIPIDHDHATFGVSQTAPVSPTYQVIPDGTGTKRRTYDKYSGTYEDLNKADMQPGRGDANAEYSVLANIRRLESLSSEPASEVMSVGGYSAVGNVSNSQTESQRRANSNDANYIAPISRSRGTEVHQPNEANYIAPITHPRRAEEQQPGDTGSAGYSNLARVRRLDTADTGTPGSRDNTDQSGYSVLANVRRFENSNQQSADNNIERDDDTDSSVLSNVRRIERANAQSNIYTSCT